MIRHKSAIAPLLERRRSSVSHHARTGNTRNLRQDFHCTPSKQHEWRHDRRERRTTDTLVAHAITCCSCSTGSVAARAQCCVRGTYIAQRWRGASDSILSLYGATGVCRYFRADAAFAKSGIYEYLEERGVFYAIRLPSNKVLQREIAALLIRPVGRPPGKPVIRYDDFWYWAESWDRARRVV